VHNGPVADHPAREQAFMASKFSKGPWTVKFNKHRNWWEIHNGHRDPIAIVYTTEDDARLLGTSLRQLGVIKHLIPIVRMREGDLRASERAALARARALVEEIN